MEDSHKPGTFRDTETFRSAPVGLIFILEECCILCQYFWKPGTFCRDLVHQCQFFNLKLREIRHLQSVSDFITLEKGEGEEVFVVKKKSHIEITSLSIAVDSMTRVPNSEIIQERMSSISSKETQLHVSSGKGELGIEDQNWGSWSTGR